MDERFRGVVRSQSNQTPRIHHSMRFSCDQIHHFEYDLEFDGYYRILKLGRLEIRRSKMIPTEIEWVLKTNIEFCEWDDLYTLVYDYINKATRRFKYIKNLPIQIYNTFEFLATENKEGLILDNVFMAEFNAQTTKVKRSHILRCSQQEYWNYYNDIYKLLDSSSC